MTLKVLLLNFPKRGIEKTPSNITIKTARIEQDPTLHDFHVIILDTDEIFKGRWWLKKVGSLIDTNRKFLHELANRFKEQITTGGVTFCFSGKETSIKIYETGIGRCEVSNYCFCPIYLGVKNEEGDTFYPRFEQLGYYEPLIRNIPIKDIKWSCYFSVIPENAKVLAVNRAGYSVFMEVPLGSGKLIMLPKFKNRTQATNIIINEIIPRMIHEEELTFVPKWLSKISTPFEKDLKTRLREIEEVKRLVYTKGKVLKRAVAFALKKIGYEVHILPDGTLPDLRIADGKRKAIVEIKGHEKRQSTRSDVLQILGYISETDTTEKGIVISNHEIAKKPSERSQEAFTTGAIQLAERNDISLISCTELYKVTMYILEGKLDDTSKIREKIMIGSGIVKLL